MTISYPKGNGLHIASISDIHLGNARTPTSLIIKNLFKAFPNNAETADLDIIFLAGDVFDRLLRFPDPDITEIEIWVAYFLRMCKQHSIIVRVLEGTPSHDWEQSSVFVRINENAQIGCNLKYVQALSIELIPELDINILYVPDEWSDTAEKTLSQVEELMASKGLSQVDYAVMHGQFPHQLPDIARSVKSHNPDDYLRIVKNLIFIGHVHNFSVHERIISHGSFDRISHGEEEAKGHVRARVRAPDDYDITFIENKSAMTYKSIYCLNDTLEEAIERLQLIVDKLPIHAAIRVVCKKSSPLVASIPILESRWPTIIWSKKVEDSDGEIIENNTAILAEDTFVPIEITKQNVSMLVMDRIRTKTADEEILSIAAAFISEVQ